MTARRPGLLDIHRDLDPTRPSAQELRRAPTRPGGEVHGDEAVHDVCAAKPECRVDVIRNGTFFDFWSEVVADTGVTDDLPCPHCMASGAGPGIVVRLRSGPRDRYPSPPSSTYVWSAGPKHYWNIVFIRDGAQRPALGAPPWP